MSSGLRRRSEGRALCPDAARKLAVATYLGSMPCEARMTTPDLLDRRNELLGRIDRLEARVALATRHLASLDGHDAAPKLGFAMRRLYSAAEDIGSARRALDQDINANYERARQHETAAADSLAMACASISRLVVKAESDDGGGDDKDAVLQNRDTAAAAAAVKSEPRIKPDPNAGAGEGTRGKTRKGRGGQ